jgi:hypothetical protein
MALTYDYDSTLARIQLFGALSDGTPTYAVFDRTTDGVNYTPVRGGNHVTVKTNEADIDDYEFPAGIATTYRLRSYDDSDVLQETLTVEVTQDLTEVWFKSVTQAYLNQTQKVTGVGEISRDDRGGVFPILGRSLPVVVSDVRGSRKINLQIQAVSDEKRDDWDYFLASGDPVFIHVPSTNIYVQSGYYHITSSPEVLVGQPNPDRFFNLSLVQMAKPTDDLVPVTYSWQGLKNDYATWADVIATETDWNDVLNNVGDPEDVIIP